MKIVKIKVLEKTLEKAILELLTEAFERKYDDSPNMGRALEQEKTDFQNKYGAIEDWLTRGSRGYFGNSLIWLGLGKEENNDPDLMMRFKAEYNTLTRPSTLEECIDRYKMAGEKHARKSFAGGNETTIDLNKLSDEIKTELYERYVGMRAEVLAEEQYNSQFNNLVGLIYSAYFIGEDKGEHIELYKLLEKKVKENHMENIPPINLKKGFRIDIYGLMIDALSSLQRGKELYHFWIDKFHNTKFNLKNS